MKVVKFSIWALLLLAATTPAAYSQSLWNTAADGSWQTPGNWSPSGVPGAGDNATINLAGGPYVVTLNSATAISNLTIDTATATLNTNSQNFTINGSFNLLAGTFTQTGGSVTGTLATSMGTTWSWNNSNLGTGSYTNGGTLNSLGSNNRGLSGSLVNKGTWNVQGTGNILANNGSSISNAGLIDLQVNNTFVTTGQTTLTVTNTGTLRKSVGTGTSNVNAIFISTGTIDAQTGTLNFNNGGTVTNTISAATGAVVNLETLTLSGAISGTGAGIVRINGNVSIATGGATLTYGNTSLDWSTGTISGPGPLTNAGNLTITGAPSSSAHFLSTTLNNTGTITVTGTDPIGANNGSAITNSGLIDLQVNSTFVTNNQTTLTFTNSGTLRKSAGTAGTGSTINAIFNSTGIVDAQTGTLAFNAGGTVTNTITAATGAVVELSTLTLSGAISGSGAGNVRINGTVAVATGGATLTYGGGSLQWTTGTISGPGPLTNAGNLTITGAPSSSAHFLSTTLNNTGTITVTGTDPIGANNGSAITNSGLIDLQVNSTFVTNNQITLTLTNTGTVRKSAGTGTSTINAFVQNNSGTIAIDTGTIQLSQGLSFNNNSTLAIVGGATSNTLLTVVGLVQKTGSDPLLVRASNDGTLDLTGATEYSWRVLDGTNLGTLTTADFAFAPIDFNAINPVFSFGNNDVFVTFKAVPVPEPMALAAVGLIRALVLRRRRT